MNSNRTVYWIVLGALALGLNSEYRRGGLPALHQAVERADAELCQAASRAERTVAMAKMAWDAELDPIRRAGFARAQAEVARERARQEADMFRQDVRNQVQVQMDLARARVDMERVRMRQIRVLSSDQVGISEGMGRRVVLTCPKTGASLMVEQPDESEF